MAEESAAATLADRYGTRRRPGGGRRGVLAVAGAVLVLAAVAWAGWVAFSSSRTPVRWQDGAFTLVDDGHATLAFHVSMAPGRSGVCTVRMFNSGLTEVGRIDVPVGPSDRRTFSVTARVPTFEAATSGTVRACALR